MKVAKIMLSGSLRFLLMGAIVIAQRGGMETPAALEASDDPNSRFNNERDGIWNTVLEPNQGSIPVAILVDKCRTHRAFQALRGIPEDLPVYLVTFNSTRMDPGEWTTGKGVIMHLSGLQDSRENLDSSCLAFYSIFKSLKVQPQIITIIIVTSRPPSDKVWSPLVLQDLITKNIKLYVIWTGNVFNESSKEYQETSEKTGGKMILNYQKSSSLSDLGNNTQRSNEIILATRQGISGEQIIFFTVDKTVTKVSIILTGGIETAKLQLPNGIWNELKGRETNLRVQNENVGEWKLQTKGDDYDIVVEGIGGISFKAESEPLKGKSGKSVLTLMADSKIDQIENLTLLDESGNKLAQLPSTKRDTKADIFSTHFEMTSDLSQKSHYTQLTGKDARGEGFTRMSYVTERLPIKLPTSIELLVGSELSAEPGEEAKMLFEVKNNNDYPAYYNFLYQDKKNLIVRVHPQRAFVEPKGTVQLIVKLVPRQSLESTSDLISITAEQDTNRLPFARKQYVRKKVLFKVGKKVSDTAYPDVSFSYNGDCKNTLTPDNCYANTWGIQLTMQDSQSGLLHIKSEPGQILLKEEFIAGTTDPVYGNLEISCCFTKISLTVTDVSGNVYKKVFDIEKAWLTTGEIAAVVLGVVVLIIIIILIIVGILFCVKKKRTKHYYVNN